MANRGTVLSLQQTRFVTEDCGNCGVLFAMPEDLWDRRQKDHRSFWCPNGHSMSFSGKTEEEKLREQLAARDAQLERERLWRKQANELRERTEKSNKALRGHLTRHRKRAAAGVCPCCKRTFSDMARHMASKHPGYADAEIG